MQLQWYSSWFHFCWLVSPMAKSSPTFWNRDLPAGGAKAFSTCSSHLTVVVLFYSTASTTYLQPKPNQSEETGKLISLFYTVWIPTLNPIIFTLRNKDTTVALRKLLSKLSTWFEGLKLQKQFVSMFPMQIHQKILSSLFLYSYKLKVSIITAISHYVKGP